MKPQYVSSPEAARCVRVPTSLKRFFYGQKDVDTLQTPRSSSLVMATNFLYGRRHKGVRAHRHLSILIADRLTWRPAVTDVRASDRRCFVFILGKLSGWYMDETQGSMLLLYRGLTACG